MLVAALASAGCGTLLGFDQDYKSSGGGGSTGGGGSGAAGNTGTAGDTGSAGDTGTAGQGAGGHTGGTGAGGHTGGTGTGAGGGSAGGVPCIEAAECADDTNPCSAPACTDGFCDFVFVQNGTLIGDQVMGDCRDLVCDGAGAVMAQDNTTDLPTASQPCYVGSCAGGVAQEVYAASGTACFVNGGTQCNGAGVCVECTLNNHCPSNVCSSGICQSGSCIDGTKNNGESDTDCGGACGANCMLGKLCNSAADCTSNYCSSGQCAQKPNGQDCSAAIHCQSGLCIQGVCCNDVCNGPCDSCGVPGSEGTCTPIPAGQTGDCVGTVCNSFGQCGVCSPGEPLGMCCVPCENPATPSGAKADSSDTLPPPSPGDCCTPQFCTPEGDYPPCPL